MLRDDIVINRITGDPDKTLVIEPKWLLKKFCVLNEIDKEMENKLGKFGGMAGLL